ncbi:hypothetical protein PG993_005405 [Apiospora rasikravindrae]|uniref:Uncharacterized protein n=1 Tax=Apiospora rasikravindrae TaxID=990691 RepID=A0ABR1THE3_9PEZI
MTYTFLRQILVVSLLLMLAMMVAGTPIADTVAQPSLHEVKTMLTEAAKLHEGNAAPAAPTDPQFAAATGPNDGYIVDCGGSYIRSYMCWYYNNTRCFAGRLTSNDPQCLEDCKCTKWTGPDWGLPSYGNGKLSNDTPASNESSHTAERSVAHQEIPSNDDKEKRSLEEDLGLYDLSCRSKDQTAVCHGVGVGCDQNGQITGPHLASCSPPICACHQRPGNIMSM